jgi:predicted RNA binding protein YcfA (HicA-like mRNA interferase family)
MPGLPAQLPWRRFICVLRKLGYTAQKGKAGAVRAFTNPNRTPNVVSFREPHPGKNLGATTLRKYLRQLLLNEDEFLHFLEDC